MVRILVVDDEIQACILVKKYFELTGRFIVDYAANGQEALEKLQRHPSYDLMILDLVMPVMNGEALLREAHLFPKTKIIILTAHGSLGTAITALRASVSDYLPKPISLAELLSVVDSLTQVYRFAGLELVVGRYLTFDGEPVEISERLLEILSIFMKEPRLDRTFDYIELAERVENKSYNRQDATDLLSSQISRLRRILKELMGFDVIQSKAGIGFYWSNNAWKKEHSLRSKN